MPDRPGRRPAPLHPLFELTRTRLLEFCREPEAIFWTFVFPVILAMVLGVAFRNQPAGQPRLAITGPAPAASRLRELLQPHVSRLEVLSAAEARRRLGTGGLDLVLEMETAPGKTDPTLVCRYDRSRPEGRLAWLELEQRLRGESPRLAGWPVRQETVPAAGGRYIDFLIPGLIGLNLMGSGMWGIGFTVVMARVNKLLKRLAATPMHRAHYLLGFILSRLVLLVPEVAALIFFGWLLFDVRMNGSWPQLAVLVLLIAFTFTGLGLFTASRARTIEAVSGWMNLVMLPMWVFSGSFFPAERYPDFLQPVIRALPLTAANDALRAVMSDGVPLLSAWPALLILTAWCLAGFAAALRIFRWQ